MSQHDYTCLRPDDHDSSIGSHSNFDLTMSLPQSANTLIVGAGPTGLAVALSLVHQGFRDFVIVDALAKGENNSRALIVHAATLEVSGLLANVTSAITIHRLSTP